MLTKQQLNTMLSLQNNMNIKVNPEWLTAGYGYLRAAMVE
ncbi:MAG: dUTP diphosphatase, partial [Aestuariibacter sp.]|nr:dUTP diphosphatase [Aestuariibacter sp.]MCP4948437.1 dUTP diphosphatase [Aestuariibacter sp.]